ncbi:MAG TPA: pirin family protein [Bacteroidia bacterium]|nr:pirin family protein [Bacteroidia bacterium]
MAVYSEKKVISMHLDIIHKAQQGQGEFNFGAILENKPIGFPGDGGRGRPYSNLFYWAHAWTPEGDSTIGLHPHKGFEIMSFVLRGEIEHYDTQLRQWRTLRAGDVQIIRAGNGISHSEKIKEKSSIFQIWMDPNLNVTLGQPASYDDYASEAFPVSERDGMAVKTYKGEGSPLHMVTPGVVIEELRIPQGTQEIKLGKAEVLSGYLLGGQLEIDGKTVEVDDFLVASGADAFTVNALEDSKLFVIRSPMEPGYPTYARLSR